MKKFIVNILVIPCFGLIMNKDFYVFFEIYNVTRNEFDLRYVNAFFSIF